ncbi:MAG TPA: hypothetical protein VG204_11640 [Terriglobia bacterium]|nr:hypothetical protein [Terriglobia bacterium]
MKATDESNVMILEFATSSNSRPTTRAAWADPPVLPKRHRDPVVLAFPSNAVRHDTRPGEGPDEPPPKHPAKIGRSGRTTKGRTRQVVTIQFPQRGNTMENEIRTGTILIEDDELLPETLRCQTQPYSRVWRLVHGMDRDALGRQVEQAGWTFFYTEGAISATAVGLDSEKTLHRTIGRIIAKLKWDKFNCLEVTRVAEKRMFGFSKITVVACWRLLGPSLASTPELSLPSASLFRRRSVAVEEQRWAA